MPNNLRGRSRVKRIALHDEVEASNPSYFEWREQTVRMPAVTLTSQQTQPGTIVRLLRRIAARIS